MPRFVSLLVVLLLTAGAQAQLSVFPPGPTSDDEVVVRFTSVCEILGYTVTRNGPEIQVAIGGVVCGTPPIEIPYDISLGELPPGQYRVTVANAASLSFVVRNGDSVPLTFRPWAVPTDSEGMLVHLTGTSPDAAGLCGGPDCSSFRLDLGGTIYRIQDLVFERGSVAVRAPSHAPGLVDARLTNANGTFVLPAALYYFDPGTAPDPSVFERVLFPVLFGSDGANGSRWRSEAVIANPNPWAMQNWNTVQRVICVRFPCSELVGPKSRSKFEGEGYPRGVALLVPRGEADDLSFSVRIRDVSRDAETFGAQVPVVRERDMLRNTEATLLDVPLDPRFRTKLRVYAFLDPIYREPRSIARALVHAGPRAEQAVELVRSCSGDLCATVPFYGELDLAPGAQGEFADVYVSFPEGAFGWAFASVTNNVTQQVTIVAPDGKGGRP